MSVSDSCHGSVAPKANSARSPTAMQRVASYPNARPCSCSFSSRAASAGVAGRCTRSVCGTYQRSVSRCSPCPRNSSMNAAESRDRAATRLCVTPALLYPACVPVASSNPSRRSTRTIRACAVSGRAKSRPGTRRFCSRPSTCTVLWPAVPRRALRSAGSRAYTKVPRSTIRSTPPSESSTEFLSLCACPPVPPWPFGPALMHSHASPDRSTAMPASRRITSPGTTSFSSCSNRRTPSGPRSHPTSGGQGPNLSDASSSPAAPRGARYAQSSALRGDSGRPRLESKSPICGIAPEGFSSKARLRNSPATAFTTSRGTDSPAARTASTAARNSSAQSR